MEAYRIGMEIALSGNAAAGLSSIIAQMGNIEGYQKRIEKGFLGWNKAIIGAGAVIAGAGIGAALAGVASHGDKLLDQQDKLRRAGISHNEVLQLQKRYYDDVAKAVPTSTVSEYLRTYNELRSVVGAERAAEKTPWALKLESIMQNMTGKSAQGEAFKIFRSLEMKGITISDPQQSERLAEIMMKNIIGSGGKLTAHDFELIAKRGGISWAQAGSRFVAGPLSNIASDLGGASTGTALQTLYQMTSGATTLGKQQAGELLKLGLLDRNMVEFNEGGDMTKVQPGAMAGWKLAMTDPDLWAQKYLLPALEKTYGTDRASQLSSIAKIGRNRNVIRMLNFFTDPGFREQMMKDAELWAQAHGIDESYRDFIKNNPLGVKNAFWQQYESMMQSIGAPMMVAALPVMQKVTEMFTAIGKFANENPKKMESIGKAIAGISAGLAALGTVLIGTAILGAISPAGWVVTGLLALAAVFSKSRWHSLADIERDLKRASVAFDGFRKAHPSMMAFLKGIKDTFTGNWKELRPDVQGFLGAMKSAMQKGWQIFLVGWEVLWGLATQALPKIFKDVINALAKFKLVLDACAAVSWDLITTGLSSVKDAFNAAADWVIGVGTKLWNFVTTLGGLLGKTGFSGGGGGDDGAIIKASYGGAAADFGGSTGGGAGGSNDNVRRVGRRFMDAGRSGAAVTGGGYGGVGRRATLTGEAHLSATAAWSGLTSAQRGLLDAITGPEGRGEYNVWIGGSHFKGYDWHPGRGPMGYDAGRYQFLKRTWNYIARKYGIKDFTPESQDKAALALAREVYGKNFDRDLESGNFDPRRLQNTWVSIRNLGAANWMRRYFNPAMRRAMAHPKGHAKPETASPGPPPKRKEDDRIISVHLDGHTVGRLVERRIVASHKFTRGSADHDGRAGIPPVDYHRVA